MLPFFPKMKQEKAGECNELPSASRFGTGEKVGDLAYRRTTPSAPSQAPHAFVDGRQ